MKNLFLTFLLLLIVQSSFGAEKKCEVKSVDRLFPDFTYTPIPKRDTEKFVLVYAVTQWNVVLPVPTFDQEYLSVDKAAEALKSELIAYVNSEIVGLEKRIIDEHSESGYKVVNVEVVHDYTLTSGETHFTVTGDVIHYIRGQSGFGNPDGYSEWLDEDVPMGVFIYRMGGTPYCSKPGYTLQNNRCYLTKIDYVECPEKPRKEKAKGEPKSCKNLVGNPINLESGAKYLKEDYPQFKGFDFYFSYSGPMVDYGESTEKGTKGSWVNSYQRKIKPALNSVGEPDAGGKYLELHQADGKVLVFVKQEAGVVPLDSDVIETVEYDSVNNQWVVINSSNETERYDSSGRLVSISTRTGSRRVLDYDENALTATVTHQATGRTITLQYSNMDFSQVTAVTGPQGYLYQYNYADNGMLEQATYPSESGDPVTITYHYDSQYTTRLTSITDETGANYTRWGYDYYGRANLSEKGKEGSGIGKKSLEYTNVYQGERDSLSVVVTNALNKKSIYHYKVLQGTRKLVHLEGEALGSCAASDSYYSYDDFGFERTMTDNKGNVTETVRNSRGLVEEMRNALVWSSGVNTDLVETADTQKIETEWHDVLSLPESRTYYSKNDSGVLQPYKREEWTYTPENRVSEFTVTDLTTYTEPYSTYGRTKVVTNLYEYHDAEKTRLRTHTVNGPLDPSTQSDGVDDITVTHFDEIGQVTEIVNAYGHTTTYSDYDAAGKAQTITDPNGIVRKMRYTPRGWLKSVTVQTAKGNSVTLHDYFPNGLLEKTTYADGSFISYEYDEARHVSAITNNFGERIEYPDRSLLDGKWLKETVKNSSGDVVRQSARVFDEMGRIKKLLGNNGQETEFTYDLNDNIEFDNKAGYEESPGSGNAESLQIQYGYDGLNRKTSTQDALGNASKLKYDVNGSVVSVEDPNGNITSYIYDGFGQLIQRESPDTGITSFYYDNAGNNTGIHNAKGIHFNQSFDALSRPLLRAQNLTTDDIEWVYDNEQANAIGRLFQLVDSTGVNQYSYDEFGNVVVHSQSLKVDANNSLSLNTSYGYNLKGELTSIQYPGGRILTYNSANGRINNVNSDQGSILSDVQYEPFGSIGKLTYSNGVVQSMDFDIDGRLSELAIVHSNSDIFRLNYRFDSFNNIVGIDSSTAKEANQTFVYDKAHRLKNATGQYGAISYGYDPVGNRLSRNITRNEYLKSETYHYPWTNNRVEGMTTVENGQTLERSFSYDDLGNITSDEKPVVNKELIYNAEGRLESVRHQD